MKVGMNTIGNYSPFQMNGINRTEKPVKAESVETDSFTKAEKNFFANKYPGNRQEIMDHHFYGKSGQMSGIAVGTLINRRG